MLSSKQHFFFILDPPRPHPGFYRGICRKIQIKIDIYNFFVKNKFKPIYLTIYHFVDNYDI